MRKIVLLMLTLMLTYVEVYAQTTVEPTPDYSSAFTTFAGLVAIIPFVVEGVKRIFKSISPIVIQIISWITGIAVTMFGWAFHLGFLNGLEWWQALLYGLDVSLAANGIFDTGLIEWIVGLFAKKKKNNKV